jgi:hypothetical protein
MKKLKFTVATLSVAAVFAGAAVATPSAHAVSDLSIAASQVSSAHAGSTTTRTILLTVLNNGPDRGGFSEAQISANPYQTSHGPNPFISVPPDFAGRPCRQPLFFSSGVGGIWNVSCKPQVGIDSSMAPGESAPYTFAIRHADWQFVALAAEVDLATPNARNDPDLNNNQVNLHFSPVGKTKKCGKGKKRKRGRCVRKKGKKAT